MNQFSNQYYVLWKSKASKLRAKKLYKYLPPEISMLLLTDGSFTRILDSITGGIIHLTTVNNYKINMDLDHEDDQYGITKFKIHRSIWLVNTSNEKLVFAASWWKPKSPKIGQLTHNIPLGKMLIKSELNIYRELHCIYYLYSQQLETQFLVNNNNIWSRAYTLHHQSEPFVFIKEFFSPTLIQRFKYEL